MNKVNIYDLLSLVIVDFKQVKQTLHVISETN